MRNRIDVAGYMNVEQMIIEINTSISVFRRTHKGAHRHTLVCTASRCCALLQHAFTSYFHTRTFTQMLLHTSQHTHTSLYTHIFTHMRLHSGFSTQAVAHMQYTYVFTQALLHILNTDTHALVHKHSCTHTLLHKPFHTHMLRQLFEEASTYIPSNIHDVTVSRNIPIKCVGFRLIIADRQVSKVNPCRSHSLDGFPSILKPTKSMILVHMHSYAIS